jgi:hypothetical protein
MSDKELFDLNKAVEETNLIDKIDENLLNS